MGQLMDDKEFLFRMLVLMMGKNIVRVGMRHNYSSINMSVRKERTSQELS